MAGLAILMAVVLVLFIFVVGLYLDLKTERDVNKILKDKIVRRLIQC
jgi:signal transduction histidine kinase